VVGEEEDAIALMRVGEGTRGEDKRGRSMRGNLSPVDWHLCAASQKRRQNKNSVQMLMLLITMTFFDRCVGGLGGKTTLVQP
jgi:hypothetical protein